MPYAGLRAGATVFLDASILIHHFEPSALHGPPATELLERIENQEVIGVTTTHVVSEVAHRLMTMEAMQAFGWNSAGIATRLRINPAQVQALKRFRQAIQEIALFTVRILTLDPSWPDLAAEVGQQTGLLHNDALIVVALRVHGLSDLASADSDFDSAPGIIWSGPS